MQLIRKTTEKEVTFRGRVLVWADNAVQIGAGGEAKPSKRYLIANQIFPDLTIEIPGFGQAVLSPGEVKALLDTIDDLRAAANYPQNYIYDGRACSKSI